MHALDIAEVARRSGVAASALRYYEEKGLIASIGRRGLRRVFAPGVIERLALIALGRAAGFSLDQIAGLFGADGEPAIDRQLLSDRAEELDRTNERARAFLQAQGYTFTQVDRAALQQRLRASGFYERWRERLGEPAWQAILRARRPGQEAL